MGLLRLLLDDPATFILLAIPLLYSIIIHEVAHGWVAEKMGDPTARWLGRITLDPRPHIDPIGTLMLFLFGFGWAKPVPVNFNNLRDRKSEVFVAGAGITANMILAFISQLVLRLLPSTVPHSVNKTLYYMFVINIMLASFNLIPIPPLDGSRILSAFTSDRVRYSLARIEPYGFFIIVGLLYLGVLSPLIGFFQWIIVSIINALVP
jgi:Zn-dependent protease